MVAFRSALDYLDADDLTSRFDLRDYVQVVCSGNWRKTGRAVQGLNPLDPADAKPSFTVYENGYKEFGNGGDSGSRIDFVMRLHGLDYLEALRHIADFLGGAPTFRTMPRPPERRKIAPTAPVASWQAVAAVEIERAQRYLFSDTPDARHALDYLRHTRGLTDDIIRAVGLGYNPAWRKTAYIKDDGKAAYMPPGITIPWYVDGELWTIRVRCRVGNLAEALGIDPDTNRDGERLDKYLSFAGSKQSGALYIAGDLLAERDTLIVEGEFDALLAAQQLDGAANVITLGSASNRLTEGWRDRLATSSRVLLSLDADTAGEGARKALITALGGRVPLLTLTILTGKDITDHVVLHGSTVAALIADARPVALLGVPDGIRAAALNCKLDAGLIVYELAMQAGLARFTRPALAKANKEFAAGVTTATLYRGTDDAVDMFFSKSVLDHTLTKDELIGSSSADFEKNRNSGGCVADCLYELLPLETIRANLLGRLRNRLIDAAYGLKGKNVILPPLDDDLLVDVPTDDSDALIECVKPAMEAIYRAQDEIKARRLSAEHKCTYQKLTQNLKSDHSTPLLPGWGKGSMYSSIFYRAVHEADPRPRNAHEIACITGRKSNNVKAVVERAGVETIKRPPTVIPFELTSSVAIDAKRAAKGQGKIFEIVAMIDDQQVDRAPFNEQIITDDLLHRWGLEQVSNGATLAAVIHVCNEQKIVGPIRPPMKRPGRVNRSEQTEATDTNNKRDKGVASPDVKLVKPFTGPGYSPEYRRDFWRIVAERGQRLGLLPVLHDFEPAEVIVHLLCGRDVSAFAATVPILSDDDLISAWALLSVVQRMDVDELLNKEQQLRVAALAYHIRECVIERSLP